MLNQTLKAVFENDAVDMARQELLDVEPSDKVLDDQGKEKEVPEQPASYFKHRQWLHHMQLSSDRSPGSNMSPAADGDLISHQLRQGFEDGWIHFTVQFGQCIGIKDISRAIGPGLIVCTMTFCTDVACCWSRSQEYWCNVYNSHNSTHRP